MSFQYSHISLLGSNYILILAWHDFNKNESWQQPASVPQLLLSTLIVQENKHGMCTSICAFTPMRQVPSPKYFYYHLQERGVGIEAAINSCCSSCPIPHHTGWCRRYLLDMGDSVLKIKRELLRSHWQEACSAASLPHQSIKPPCWDAILPQVSLPPS